MVVAVVVVGARACTRCVNGEALQMVEMASMALRAISLTMFAEAELSRFPSCNGAVRDAQQGVHGGQLRNPEVTVLNMIRLPISSRHIVASQNASHGSETSS